MRIVPKGSGARPHIAVFVVDRQTSAPLSAIPLTAVAEQKGGRRLSLGSVVTDKLGYASFDAKSLQQTAEYVHLWVHARFEEDRAIDVLPQVVRGDRFVRIAIEPSPLERYVRTAAALQAADIQDWRQSPASVAINPSFSIGHDDCTIPFLYDQAVHTFRLRRVVAGKKRPEPHERAEPDACAPGKRAPQPVCLREGEVREYTVSWYPLGHALGQLQYTLPLAPCESVNLAVVDWSRFDEASRQEALSVSESLAHDLRRDRVVAETIEAAVDEWQGGGSLMGGLAGSYGADSGMSVSGAIGGAYSTSSGEREVEADSLQRLSDDISQASTSVRNLRSTIVFAASQRERDAITTRTVTNHNHCHAMTVMYYEVLRKYRVVTEWTSREPVVLVQYRRFVFNESRVLRHRLVLERALLDRRLRKCFAAVERQMCPPEESAATTAPSADLLIDTLDVRIVTGDNGTEGEVFFNLRLREGAEVPCVSLDPSAEIMRQDPGPGGGHAYPSGEFRRGLPRFRKPLESEDRIDQFARGQMAYFILKPSTPVRWRDIERVELFLNEGDAWRVASLYVATLGERTWVLFDDDIDERVEVGNPVRRDVVPHGLPEAPRHDLATDRCCVMELLRHLNAHRMHYLRAIWLHEDPDERAIRFDSILYRDGRLMDYIENRPRAVLGHYVAFPVLSEKPPAMPDIDPVERLVTLPARGVFAEAQLSNCNACEKRDITRFWDWTESPCPDKAPPIEGVRPGSRAQPSALTAAGLPASIVNITAPPNAPDPSGLSGALQVLQASNIFRDMSGLDQVSALLQKLADGTVSMENAQLEARTALEKARLESNTTLDRARIEQAGGGGGRQPRPAPRDVYDYGSVLDDAVREGRLTPEQANALYAQYAGEVTGATPDTMMRLIDYRLPPDYSSEEVASVLGFDAAALSAAASSVSAGDIIDRLRGTRPIEAAPREVTQGLYYRLSIPDTAAANIAAANTSWRSWVPEEVPDPVPDTGIGGGWFIPARLDENGEVITRARWIDFWRSAADRDASSTPLVYRLIERLRDLADASLIVQQLARVVKMGQGGDVALALVTAFRESEDGMFRRGWVDSYFGSGLDFFGTEARMLTDEGYLRDVTGAYRRLEPHPGEGETVTPASIRGEILTEAVMATLNRRAQRFRDFASAEPFRFAVAEANDTARRIWYTAWFGGERWPATALRAQSAGGAETDLDTVVGHGELQRYQAIKRGHVSAGEAEVLEALVIREAQALYAQSHTI
jgi:hypothetical protein